MDFSERSKLLIGEANYSKLKSKRVALFGVGGVGGICAEALIRSGIVSLALFDNDVVKESNINRQIVATSKTLSKIKVQEIKSRLLEINPDAEINAFEVFYLPENADNYDLTKYDYIIDAVDTVSAKIEIIKRAKELGVKVISCMGTGGKTDITKLAVDFIENTNGCPLARVMRRELKKRGISGVKAVYSKEITELTKECGDGENTANTGRIIPSMMFVPSAAGLMLAKEVIFDLIKE